ncbi:MAG: pantoate--beta-alanine ligase [Phyllobacterium sp.]|uniref:pantoate--beta-alanine ligase n=1 Tax=Phyllobacterium sp. TaxID=1871046 RepID=UPI0030F12E35
MKVIATVAELRATLKAERQEGKSIGLVPTMGYLHIGHMELVRCAKRATDVTVVSIFVNPTQFAPNEDLSSYPRDMDGDLAKLNAEGVDYVFTPEVAEIYRQGAHTIVDNPVLSRILVGKIRPGHFRGVTTIVTKLFNIVQPDHAFFGEKDYQQLTIIRRMVADLDMPIEITGVATVRDEDGVACSSRNAMLTATDRKAAVVLSRALAKAEAMVAQGQRSVPAIRNAVRAVLDTEKRGTIESVDLRDARTLDPVSGKFRQPVVILLTVQFGKVRLIDQRVVG